MLKELRSNLEFFLSEWLGVDELLQRSRFKTHSWESITDLLQAAQRLAADKLEPFDRQIDSEPPRFDGDHVILPLVTYDAWNSIVDFGIIGAAEDFEFGGMQLPRVAEMAVTTLFAAAAIAIGPEGLTSANASLIIAYGTDKQGKVFAAREIEGRWAGTMCLSEPQAGSSVSDISTRAVADGADYVADPLGPRYRISGRKMWISGGEHELTENIVHLVLAKTSDSDGRIEPGTRGISLFIVPKFLIDLDGNITERNDVGLIGLNHKIGYRGLPNASLSFGDGSSQPLGRDGAVGYLVGSTGQGLKQMFHMMNEFRIKVGAGAAALGFAGYSSSLEYARIRTQGRHMEVGGKAADKPQVPIIEHADVKRMLLAQKSYSEGAIALSLYGARLLDEQKSADVEAASRAALLLETLTPIIKSWPSEWCLEGNNLAIQVLGGVGYTPEFQVEQYWRDNRLNMIHEGTHGIQAIDLLGRKVVINGGDGLTVLLEEIDKTIKRARDHSDFSTYAEQLSVAASNVRDATEGAWSTQSPREALANATPYMQGVGHVVIAWIWLDIVYATRDSDSPLVEGKRAAMRYFFSYELPKIHAWLDVARNREMICADMKDEWF